VKDRSIFIAAALESIGLIQDYTEGYSLYEFLEDRKTQDAVIRNLEVIGQALKDFGIADLNEIVPEMPWRQISGMRNILAHEYLGVDMVMIWDTLKIHLSPLQTALLFIHESVRENGSSK
jgi:uncharacterized protein with HEPN domain